MSPGFRRLWGWPIALGVLSCGGLLSALVGDGVYDLLSWLGLGMPLLVAARHGWRR